MTFNFVPFYNYIQFDNSSLASSSYCTYSPELELSFSVSTTSKLHLLQTFELLYQFFQIRPIFSSVKHFGKVVRFNMKLSIKGYTINNFFRTIYRIRSSSKFKLIKFTFSKSGRCFILFNDFTTLFPFEIKFYDFHTWRNLVSVYSKSNVNEVT